MFRPNQICLLSRRTGRDEYAQETFSDPVEIGYSPVRLERKVEKTSVRADSSASRGQADQVVVNASILVEKTVTLALDDRLTIEGDDYRVSLIHRRKNVFGVLDHLQVDLEPMP
jgi:hypothetical protein